MIETRFERKWVIKNIFISQLISALKISNFEFIKHHNSRWVNSIYYDDMFNSSVYQNLNGDQKKQKIRLRWYGKKKIFNPKVEIKTKNMFLTTKTNKKIFFKGNYPDNKMLLDINDKVTSVSPFLVNHSPKTSTHYFRHYFVSKNKKIRATIDENIYYLTINNLKINLAEKRDFNLILELKYDRIYDEYVRQNFSKNNSLRISKNSKFINSFFFYK
tara:strand:- start:120 stop:767 length:648 start_codon:yes stop_codon:yes gene_type:complete